MHIPEVKQIEVVARLGTSSVNYVVIAASGQTFTREHKQALEQRLRQLPGLHKYEIIVTFRNEHSRLALVAEPADTTAGQGVFTIYRLLKEIYQPAVAYTGLMRLLSPRQPRGEFTLGLQVLDHPDQATLNQLTSAIQKLSGTIAVKHTPGEPNQLLLEVEGTWQSVTQDYPHKLLCCEIAAVLLV